MAHRTRTLIEMLSYCRPSGSTTERAWIDRFLLTLPGAYEDRIGNVHCLIGDGAHPIVWCAHTDTVHRQAGRQAVVWDRALRALYLPFRSGSSCLGGDDTVGSFLLREMVLAGRHGHYVWHTAEEIGGIGSSYLAEEESVWCGSLSAVIALDRAGRRDVITHQYGRRTASDQFARSLCVALNRHGLQYVPCSGGVYTDSAEYADLVPECSNVSVGYARQHTAEEWIDLDHVFRLRQALLTLDPACLTIARTPEPEHVSHWTRHGSISRAGIDRYDEETIRQCWDRDGRIDRSVSSSAPDPREGSVYLSEEYEALVRHEQEQADLDRAYWDRVARDPDRVWSDEHGYTWRSEEHCS